MPSSRAPARELAPPPANSPPGPGSPGAGGAQGRWSSRTPLATATTSAPPPAPTSSAHLQRATTCVPPPAHEFAAPARLRDSLLSSRLQHPLRGPWPANSHPHPRTRRPGRARRGAAHPAARGGRGGGARLSEQQDAPGDSQDPPPPPAREFAAPARLRDSCTRFAGPGPRTRTPTRELTARAGLAGGGSPPRRPRRAGRGRKVVGAAGRPRRQPGPTPTTRSRARGSRSTSRLLHPLRGPWPASSTPDPRTHRP